MSLDRRDKCFSSHSVRLCDAYFKSIDTFNDPDVTSETVRAVQTTTTRQLQPS